MGWLRPYAKRFTLDAVGVCICFSETTYMEYIKNNENHVFLWCFYSFYLIKLVNCFYWLVIVPDVFGLFYDKPFQIPRSRVYVFPLQVPRKIYFRFRKMQSIKHSFNASHERNFSVGNLKSIQISFLFAIYLTLNSKKLQ